MDTPKRPVLVVVLLWATLTLLGEILAVRYNPFPAPAAEEGERIDHAFRWLMYLAVPVFAFVVSVLLYSVLRFRAHGPAPQDGPPVHTHGAGVATWFLVTAALTITISIFPGALGLIDIRRREHQDPDLIVRVDGMRWSWTVTYPQYDVSTLQELVLPVGKRVRFEVTSRDVVHSFWVPAFRVKIDAVPGIVTYTSAVPTRLGSFAEDATYRVQCAELCGTLHARMVLPVRVVEQEEFNAWLATQRKRQ
ncbi:Cytochrome c oxidase subunit 2 [bacterium HR23]|nr:Cytochrome c oxidase subunit 2 [bacterium HR23]